MRASIFFLVSMSIAAGLASAQNDWTGYYALANNRDLAGTGLKPVAPGGELDKLIIAHFQPWAKARMEATDGIADDNGGVCLPTGIFRYPYFAGRFLWLAERDRIVMVFGALNTAGVRRIYLNGQHPRNLLPTFNGHSIGRWEGDTLLVDSIGFNDKTWLMTAMEPHTEEAHLMERMRLMANGKFMENVVVVEDRQALASAYTFTRYYKRLTEEMAEDVCNEDPEVWKKYKYDALQKQIDRAKQVK